MIDQRCTNLNLSPRKKRNIFHSIVVLRLTRIVKPLLCSLFSYYATIIRIKYATSLEMRFMNTCVRACVRRIEAIATIKTGISYTIQFTRKRSTTINNTLRTISCANKTFVHTQARCTSISNSIQIWMMFLARMQFYTCAMPPIRNTFVVCFHLFICIAYNS